MQCILFVRLDTCIQKTLSTTQLEDKIISGVFMQPTLYTLGILTRKQMQLSNDVLIFSIHFAFLSHYKTFVLAQHASSQ